jgi:Tol biopolymer transport system component
MTARDDFDRTLSVWLTAQAPTREPEHLLDHVLERTARTRRRPAWRIPERWIPMSVLTSRSASVSQVPWRTVGLIALLVLALVGGALLIAGARRSALPPPFGAAANGQLAYSVDGDIVVVDGLSGTPRTIVGGPTTDSGPLFSPDGTRFAFVRGRMDSTDAQLWIANADGSDARVLAPSPRIGWAEWSPQSDVVAVLEDGDPSIVRLIDVQTSAITKIDTGLDYVQSILWRPTDGRQLTLRAKDASGSWGLYLMGRDSANPRRLDLDPGYETDAEYAVNIDEYFMGPTWTPDGTRLIYYGLEPDPSSPAGPGYRIHVANVDADGLARSDQVHEFVASNDDEFNPIVLPDGDTVVFQSKEGSLQQVNVGSLSGRTSPRPLDLSANEYWIPSVLSPDGRQILSRLPAAGSAELQTWATDLTTFMSSQVDIGGDDLTWQRRAP